MDKNKILLYIGILILVYLVLRRFNLIKSPLSTSPTETISERNFWLPTYYKAGDKITEINAARRLAKIVYDAKGYFTEDENAVFGVFSAFRYKTQVSHLAKVFFDMYKKDLRSYILETLNESEIERLNSITSKLL